MCECLHRARARKIWLKNGASPPTCSFSIGDFRWQTTALESSQYFIGGMMPESANPVQQPQTIIEIRPYRGGWQCYEGQGVGPYWVGEKAKDDAIGYARGRTKFGDGEIRVLNGSGSIECVIPFKGKAQNP